MKTKIKILIIFIFTILLNYSCSNESHIEEYEINLDSLKTLPNGFYAYRRGRVYFSNQNSKNYRVWYNLNISGDIESVFKIEDLDNNKSADTTNIRMFGIDTNESKIIAQKFIHLSQKFKFGHISIDKKNKISFSYRDGLAEQYVKTLNDSVNGIYLKDKEFKLLKNGWFENIEH